MKKEWAIVIWFFRDCVCPHGGDGDGKESVGDLRQQVENANQSEEEGFYLRKTQKPVLRENVRRW